MLEQQQVEEAGPDGIQGPEEVHHRLELPGQRDLAMEVEALVASLLRSQMSFYRIQTRLKKAHLWAQEAAHLSPLSSSYSEAAAPVRLPHLPHLR
jgi:hypothetical protein